MKSKTTSLIRFDNGIMLQVIVCFFKWFEIFKSNKYSAEVIYKNNQEKKKIDEENIMQLKEDTELKEKEKNEKLVLENNDKKKPVKRMVTDKYDKSLIAPLIQEISKETTKIPSKKTSLYVFLLIISKSGKINTSLNSVNLSNSVTIKNDTSYHNYTKKKTWAPDSSAVKAKISEMMVSRSSTINTTNIISSNKSIRFS